MSPAVHAEIATPTQIHTARSVRPRRAEEAVQRREDEDRVVRVIVVDVREPGAAEAELDLQREHDEADHAQAERGVAPDGTNRCAAPCFYRHNVRKPLIGRDPLADRGIFGQSRRRGRVDCPVAHEHEPHEAATHPRRGNCCRDGVPDRSRTRGQRQVPQRGTVASKSDTAISIAGRGGTSRPVQSRAALSVDRRMSRSETACSRSAPSVATAVSS